MLPRIGWSRQNISETLRKETMNVWFTESRAAVRKLFQLGLVFIFFSVFAEHSFALSISSPSAELIRFSISDGESPRKWWILQLNATVGEASINDAGSVELKGIPSESSTPVWLEAGAISESDSQIEGKRVMRDLAEKDTSWLNLFLDASDTVQYLSLIHI